MSLLWYYGIHLRADPSHSVPLLLDIHHRHIHFGIEVLPSARWLEWFRTYPWIRMNCSTRPKKSRYTYMVWDVKASALNQSLLAINPGNVNLFVVPYKKVRLSCWYLCLLADILVPHVLHKAKPDSVRHGPFEIRLDLEVQPKRLGSYLLIVDVRIRSCNSPSKSIYIWYLFWSRLR